MSTLRIKYEGVSKIFRTGAAIYTAPVGGTTTMSSESVCQVACSWVEGGSFHTRLVVRFMIFTASVRNILDTPSYLSLTTKRHVFWRRFVVNVRWLRQYVEQPVGFSWNVLLNATNAGNVVSVQGTSGSKPATAERSHTVDNTKLYENDV
jgi:hypothetical protein